MALYNEAGYLLNPYVLQRIGESRVYVKIMDRVYPNLPERWEEVVKEGTFQIDRDAVRRIPFKLKTWWMRELLSTRWMRTRNALAAKIVNGEKINYAEIGAMYRPDDLHPERKIVFMLKNSIFSMDVNNQIDRLLSEQGLTADEGISMLREAANLAREKGDAKALQSIAKEILTLTGAYAQAKVKTASTDPRMQNQTQLTPGDMPKMHRILEALSDDDPYDVTPQPPKNTQDQPE